MSSYQNLVVEAEGLLREARKWQGVVRNSLVDEERVAKVNRDRCLQRIHELAEQGDKLVGFNNNGKLHQISSTAYDIQNL